MNNIRVDIRLRSIRFGFLVRPDDKENALEIFRINTCLWGGMFNPIIPCFKSIPSWWKREDFQFKNPKQIINGYLDFFEPDFLVEAEEGLAEGFGFDSERILQLTDILEKLGEERWDTFGLSVHDLYSELYQEEFRFELRHQRNMVHVEPKEEAFAGFVAANFGSFPTQEGLRYFEHNYKNIFNPEHKLLDAAVLSELYQSRYISAIGIGCEKLRIDYNENSSPMLFILDAREPKDLVDLWNLRAVYRRVVAVPIQWIEQFSTFCRNFILDNSPFRNRSRNEVITFDTLMLAPLMVSRFMSLDNIKKIWINCLHVDEEYVDLILTQYPPEWGAPSDSTFRITRPTLAADRKSIDIQISEENPEIRFDLLFPEFANGYGNRFRVVNVVRLEDWSYRNQIATVFPYNYKNPELPKFALGQRYLLSTTEGLVIFPGYKTIPESWNLVDGTTAFSQWFKANKIPSILSDAGRATQQIIETLGGCEGVDCLAHKGVIEYLNKISKRPVTKTANHQTFRNKLGKGIFETLVERRAAELGLNLKCSKCSEWSWYSLTQLDYSLTCDFCFRQFNFPIIDPINKKHSKWVYRLVGPFAQPDYAKGGYTSALAIRLFVRIIDEMHRSEVTWSSGQELTLPTGKKVEVDFMLWYQRSQFFEPDHPTETVFGEAKSFSRFEQDDVDRMKWLAEVFPDSILVFATMRERTEFSNKEINRIKKLAEWGRGYDEETEQMRAPVIVLTGTELFAADSLEFSWKEKGGKHKTLIESPRVTTRIHHLRVLADLTQQLYLGMPPYESSRPAGETTWLPAEPSAKEPEQD